MKTRFAILAALALVVALPSGLAAQQKAGTPRVITITGTDAMKFNPSQLTAKPGEKLRIVLKTVSTMPKAAMAHNFVMLKPGSDYTAFANASAMARPTYIAPKLKDQVLVASGLAGGGETVTIDFVAPTKPGKYMFICTFPGHFAGGMTGTLTVK
jgi:azurin